MAHVLNKPVLNEDETKVISGYGIMQPRIGINLNISFFNMFTKIFAGAGGIDCYTNAISDIIKITFKKEFLQEKGYMI